MGLPPVVSEILAAMAAELQGEGSAGVGVSEAHALRQIVNGLVAATKPSSTPGGLTADLRDLRTQARMLLALARQRVRDTPFHLVGAATLRLYTDASVLLGVMALLDDPPSACRARRAVGLLDRAIIVAGAVGPRRREWIHALVDALQPALRASAANVRKATGLKRRREASPAEEKTQPLFAPTTIPEPATPPRALRPDAPFVIRGYLSSGAHHPPWPALSRWKDANYLLSATGRGRLVPVEAGRAYDDEGWTQRIVPWEAFLARAGWDVSPDKTAIDDASAPLYLAQSSLFAQFPALERDTATPDYVWSDPPGEYDAPPDPLVNVWIGPGGHEVVSPAHTDPYYNCYAQVLGSKRVWIAPPDASPHMYAYDGEGGMQTGSGAAGTDGTASALAGEYMTNTSRVPLLRPVHDADFASLSSQFPAFFEHVYPRAMEAVLAPGDLLVLPPRWWHAMRGEGSEPCWSVSFWF